MQVTEALFSFLRDLKNNNNREWFQAEKIRYEAVKKEAENFFQQVFQQLKTHDTVDDMKMFRIYRDVRFSKNKEPYKTHFSCAFQREKPRYRGGYYVHLEPEGSFVGCGFWDPSPDDLKRVRTEIAVDDQSFRDIWDSDGFTSVFGSISGDRLKTVPRGFDKQHPAADLLQLKQYLAVKNFSDKEVLAPNFKDQLDICFKAVRPFFDLMSDVLTTDANGRSLLDS